MGLDPTNTPDPNRPEGILGRHYQFWNVSSFEEAECITDYPIAIPTNLPDGFVRGENIIVHKTGTSHFEDRWVEHGWGIPGDPTYAFRLEQHTWKFSLDGEPAMINGIPGERHLRPAIPPDFPPLLVFLWEEEGYWFTISGFLGGPITEEFLLEVAASLELRDAAPAIHTPTVSQACSALDPTNTPDPNRPEGIRGREYQFWNVSSFEEAECITDYPIAIPTNLPDGFIRGENIIVHKRSTSHFEDRWVEHGWGIPGDPSYGFRVSQHSWKFSLGNGEPTMINGIPGERSLRPAIPPDFPPLLTLLWEEDGYWFTIWGFLDGPITEEFLLEVAASLEPRDAVPATHTATVSQACSALDPTSTPDPNRPEGILGSISEFWNVSSFEEAECITDYPIAIPTNLPDGFIRGENIIVTKMGTSHFEDRFVEHGWYIPGDPPYGIRLSQHSRKFSLGNGEPAMINGIAGERHLLPSQSPDFPPLLSFLWEEGGYWYTIDGYLHGPITEEFLLEVAASLRLPEDGSG